MRSWETSIVQNFRRMLSDFGADTRVDAFLAALKKGLDIIDIESSVEILRTLLANAKIDETDGRFTFEASSPISEESLNKLALSIPLIAVRYFFMAEDRATTGSATGMGRVQAVSE